MTYSIAQHGLMRTWGLILVGLSLVGCDRSLDLKATETTLKEDLIKQGVASLKQVSCPELLPTGKSFDCTGIFESGVGFTIPVQHQEVGDKLKAEIPSIKGMLNMDHVIKSIREELKMGEGATIDCAVSLPYRMVTLGSTFECSLLAKDTLLPPTDLSEFSEKSKDEKPKDEKSKALQEKSLSAVKEPDKIEIAIASSGDITWQRLVAAAPRKTAIPGTEKLGNLDKPGEKTDQKPDEASAGSPSGGTTTIVPEKKKPLPPADSGDVPYDS